jgi:predicted nucleic acid-binding protein
VAIRLYLDSSAVLRAALEGGLTPDVEERLAEAELLVTSRLSLVETARAFLRVRRLGENPEGALVDAESMVASLWRHCVIWELSPEVCEMAAWMAPSTVLRSLDALHLATWVLARREIAGLEMLTADHRLQDAAQTI